MAKKKEKNKEKETKPSEMEENELEETQESLEDVEETPGEEEEEPIKMVMLPAEDVEHLKEEASKNLDNWQRERADFLNYKKRIERDQDALHARITGEIIKKYLPVLDDMERALKAHPEDSDESTWREGVDLIIRKLQKILDSEGVTRTPAEIFDPTRHEAITSEASPDHECGEIIEVVQQGYMLKDRVLRPALVRVAQ